VLRWFSPLVVGLALVAAGCGSSSSTSETTTTTETVTESTTTETTTTGETTTSGETTTEASGNGSGASGLPSANCIQAVTAFGVLGQAAAGAAGANTDQSLSTFEKYADAAPEEIRADLKTLASGYAAYIKTLTQLGIKQGETPNAEQIAKLAKASEAFNTSDFQAASQHWDAWVAKNCKQ